MLEDALKNLFPYKEISLKTGDTVQIEKCFYYIKEGQVAGTCGNKVPENFECSNNEIFGLRQILDSNFEIKTLLAKKDCELLSFQDENFIKMMDSTDKNIAVFLKSLIQHGTF